VVRISALESCGGFPTDSVTEDFLLTLRLDRLGWRTVYLNEPLSVGLAPEGMKEYYEPAAGSGAGKSGKSYQSSGATLPSLSVEKSSPAGADSQPGKSQLQEAADEMASQVADMGSVDPMNTCVISKMGEGMSELEAQNACAREQGYAEAMVLNVMKKMRIPEILHSMAYHETNLSEAMKLVKTDVDSVKKPGTIMMKPQGAGTPGGNLQETSGETPGAGKVIDLTNIADQERFKQDLMAEYAQ